MPHTNHYPNINDHIIAELDELFESCPPGKLRRSIQTLLFQYLRGVYNLEGEEFHNLMTDVQYLVEFLEEAEG